MDLTQFLLRLAMWLGKRCRVDRYALLRIYRAASKKACPEFGVQWTAIKPIFKNRRLKESLYRGQYKVEEERTEFATLLKGLNVLSEGRLPEFVERLSELALNKMEDSWWWQEDAKKRIDQLWNRPRKPADYAGSGSLKFFSTAPTSTLIPDRFLVRRPKEAEKIIEKLLDGSRGEQIGAKVALWGFSGIGKTTLAIEICRKPEIQEAFSDGTLWIRLGENSEEPIILTQRLVSYLSDQKASFDQDLMLTNALRVKLEERRFLIVLDDLRTREHLPYFIQGGARCAHLITTQYYDAIQDAVSDDDAIEVREMDENEALALLKTRIADHLGGAAIDDDLKKLAERIGPTPFLLRLASSSLAEYVAFDKESPTDEAKLQNAIKILNDSLEEGRLSALDTGNRVSATIESSLKLLNTEDQGRYRDLAVFPKGKSIPLILVHRLWAATGHMKRTDAINLCRRLYKLSLLWEFNPRAFSIRLHDLISEYLIRQQVDRLPELDNRLLDSYRAASDWHLVFDNDDRYIQENLALHLLRAGRHGELVFTVRDWRYLAKKTSACGALAVESDLSKAFEVAPDDDSIRRLRRAFSNTEGLFDGSASEQIETALLARLRHLSGSVREMPSELATTRGPYICLRFDFPDLGKTPAVNLPGSAQAVDGKAVYSCCHNPARNWVVSTSPNEGLQIWNAQTGEVVVYQPPGGSSEAMNACAISRHGDHVVCASGRTLKVWDVESQRFAYVLDEHSAAVNGCSFSTDGQLLVSASSDRTLIIWNTTTWVIVGKLVRDADWEWDDDSEREVETNVRVAGHEGAVNACAFSPNGRLIVSASDDNSLKIWDIESGQAVHSLDGHSEEVNACAFSHDGRLIVSASSDRTLRLWDAETGRTVGVLNDPLHGHSERVNGCAFSSYDELVVSASTDGTIRVWNVLSRDCVASFYDKGEMYCCLIEDNKIVAGGSRGLYFLELVIRNAGSGDIALLCADASGVAERNRAANGFSGQLL